MIPTDLGMFKNGKGPNKQNAIAINMAPMNVTAFGGLLSHMSPHNGAEKPLTGHTISDEIFFQKIYIYHKRLH
jgi:hypothetical protein